MDDSQQTQLTNTDLVQSQSVAPSLSTPVQGAAKSDDTTQNTPQSPVSAPSRESGPAILTSPESLIAPSTPEIQVSPELQKETGAEAVSETPQLTLEDAKAGIVHAKESTPVSTTPSSTITLPMTQQQAQQTIKLHKKVKDSLFWFAMLVMRQWQIANKKNASKGSNV